MIIKGLREFRNVKMWFTEINGIEILMADARAYDGEGLSEMLDFAGSIIRSRPHGSVRLLTMYSDKAKMFTNKKLFSDYLKLNRPYIKASAYYGVPKLLAPLINAVVIMAGRSEDLKLFNNENEAIQWLIERK